jgi:hypothetical protein
MDVVVPNWSEEDKDTFITIARRRKDEVALGYAVVSVGAQLFQHISLHRSTVLEENRHGKDDAVAADSEKAQN